LGEHDGRFSGSGLSEDVDMSESVFVGDSDFSSDSSEIVVTDCHSLMREIIWCRDDFVFLSSDSRVLIESSMWEVNYGGELFDIEDVLSFVSENFDKPISLGEENSLYEISGEGLEPFDFGKFERIESQIIVLIEKSAHVIDDFLRSFFVR
jgi:hypothetical protein